MEFFYVYLTLNGGVRSEIQTNTFIWSVFISTWPYMVVSEVGF